MIAGDETSKEETALKTKSANISSSVLIILEEIYLVKMFPYGRA
jgi:hypothetical protein